MLGKFIFNYVYETIINYFITIRIFVKPFIWPFIKNAKSGAQTTIYAALDPELEKTTGLYFSDCKPKEAAPAAKEESMAKWLWAVSEKWTKLNE